MEIELTGEEFARINKYLMRIQAVRTQMDSLQKQGDEAVDNANTAFYAAARRVMLESEEPIESPPPLINREGRQMVTLNGEKRTVSWLTAHDVKRVAKEEPAPEPSDEKGKDNGNSK